VIERTQAILSEKHKERRKREIQRQIENLESELTSLAKPAAAKGGSSELETQSADERYLKRGVLTLDLHTRRVSLKSHAVNLAPTSFDYLLVLARHTPNVVDYQTLVSEAQGFETDAREAQELAKWHVHHIRQAIEPDAHNPVHLINVRGTGYRLVTG
jgi:DNA-binding response OmpR family regulator